MRGAMRVRRPRWVQLGIAMIGQPIHHLVKKRQTLLEPAQLQGAGIGGDGTVIECSRHAAVAVACCGGFQTTEIWC